MKNCFEAPSFYDVGVDHYLGIKYTPGDSFHEDAYESVMVKVAEEVLSARNVEARWQVYHEDDLCAFRFLELWGVKVGELSLTEQTALLAEIGRQAELFLNDPWNKSFYEAE